MDSITHLYYKLVRLKGHKWAMTLEFYADYNSQPEGAAAWLQQAFGSVESLFAWIEAH